MRWVRTCSWAGQILLWALWLAVGLAVASRRKRLPVGAIHGRRLADAAPDRVGRNESLSLCRNGSEDAVLVEPHAVGAAAVLCRLEARASDLWTTSKLWYVSMDCGKSQVSTLRRRQ